MKPLIYISKATTDALKHCEKLMGQSVFLQEEQREGHSAIYPMHNRYFSNGDKPWVVLVNSKNTMKLIYDEEEYLINEGELVLFDDNIMHAWQMNNNDMTIYYYRSKSEQPITVGTYCLDGYFD